MPSKFTHRFLFYESWLADLNEPSKELTAEEKWQVTEAIFRAQVLGDVSPLDELPLVIRRALSLPTMTEQLRTILDKQAGASDRAQQAVAAKRAAAERRAAAARDAEQQRQQNIQQQEDAEKVAKQREFEQGCINALGKELYTALRKDFSGRDFMGAIWNLAVAGSEKCRAYMPNWDHIQHYDIFDITKYKQL